MSGKLLEINGFELLKTWLQGVIFYGLLAFAVTVMADEVRIDYNR